MSEQIFQVKTINGKSVTVGETTMARPVAVVSIGTDGVRVEPILDPTKFGIAIATAVGAMFIALGKMRRGQ